MSVPIARLPGIGARQVPQHDIGHCDGQRGLRAFRHDQLDLQQSVDGRLGPPGRRGRLVGGVPANGVDDTEVVDAAGEVDRERPRVAGLDEGRCGCVASRGRCARPSATSSSPATLPGMRRSTVALVSISESCPVEIRNGGGGRTSRLRPRTPDGARHSGVAESAGRVSYRPGVRRSTALRAGSFVRLLSVIQSFGKLAASAIAGMLWSVVAPLAAFVFASICMGDCRRLGLVATLRRPSIDGMPGDRSTCR